MADKSKSNPRRVTGDLSSGSRSGSEHGSKEGLQTVAEVEPLTAEALLESRFEVIEQDILGMNDQLGHMSTQMSANTTSMLQMEADTAANTFATNEQTVSMRNMQSDV